MKTYELTYIVSPEVTSEEAEAKAREIESAIQSKEGMILKHLNPVARTLSYPIKKRASGFLGALEFQLEPEKLVEFKGILEKDGKIVRHMVIIKEAAELKKERRVRGALKTKTASEDKPGFELDKKTESKTEEEKPAFAKGSGEAREKVELKDIEQKLDEILGE